MIDRASRDSLALTLRQLASGLITNDEFDDNAYATFINRHDDPALVELATYGWLHYDDFRKYRLRGRYALSPEERRSIARAVLFLKTNQEYVHGTSLESGTVLGGPWLRGCLIVIGVALAAGFWTYFALNTFLLGLLAVFFPAYFGYLLFITVRDRIRRRQSQRVSPPIDDSFWPYIDERASMEEFRFWPFANEKAYETALANPPFLYGRRVTA